MNEVGSHNYNNNNTFNFAFSSLDLYYWGYENNNNRSTENNLYGAIIIMTLSLREFIPGRTRCMSNNDVCQRRFELYSFVTFEKQIADMRRLGVVKMCECELLVTMMRVTSDWCVTGDEMSEWLCHLWQVMRWVNDCVTCDRFSRLLIVEHWELEARRLDSTCSHIVHHSPPTDVIIHQQWRIQTGDKGLIL